MARNLPIIHNKETPRDVRSTSLQEKEYRVTIEANPKPFDGKTILLTGGTGSFGRQFVKTMLASHKPKALRIYSRDELKQFEMQQVFVNPVLRYFIGDIRNKIGYKLPCPELILWYTLRR